MILLTLSPLNVSSEDDFFLRVWALTDVCSSSSDPEASVRLQLHQKDASAPGISLDRFSLDGAKSFLVR